VNTKRLKLLLVESSTKEAALLVEHLKQVAGFDFTFVAVQTIADAVTKLSEGGVEAIILDLNLPDSAGVSSYEQLRKSALTLPIVVLTEPDKKNLSIKALEAGADGSLVRGEFDGHVVARELLAAIYKRDKMAISTGKIEAVKPPSHKTKALPIVFIVERDPHVKSLLEEFLREGGYDIQFADDGYTALDVVRRMQPYPSLLITEMYSPHLDGLRLTRILRGEKETNSLPIIIMSPVDASVRALAAGANAFLKKPIEKNRVLITVRAVIGPAQNAGADDV
jgi:DNA-binding response OmpR family regulator